MTEMVAQRYEESKKGQDNRQKEPQSRTDVRLEEKRRDIMIQQQRQYGGNSSVRTVTNEDETKTNRRKKKLDQRREKQHSFSDNKGDSKQITSPLRA